MKNFLIRQISRRTEKLRKDFQGPLPVKGWIYSIRSALGMTLEQLGGKMEVPYQSIQKLENGEIQGSPTLRTMKTAAEALECQFVYAFIPKQDLEKLIDEQAKKKAREIVGQVAHSMALEGQSLSKQEIKIQIDTLKEDLKRGNLKKIWG